MLSELSKKGQTQFRSEAQLQRFIKRLLKPKNHCQIGTQYSFLTSSFLICSFLPHIKPHIKSHIKPHIKRHINPHINPHIKTRYCQTPPKPPEPPVEPAFPNSKIKGNCMLRGQGIILAHQARTSSSFKLAHQVAHQTAHQTAHQLAHQPALTRT